jgi:hypothetical protein
MDRFPWRMRTKGARCRCFASLSDDIIVDPRRSSGGSLLLSTASWRRKESCGAVERSIGPCDEHDETRSRQATAPIIMRSLAPARAIPCRTLCRVSQSTEGINGSMDPPITERSRRSPCSRHLLLLERMRYQIRRPSADYVAIERCLRMTTVCYMNTAPPLRRSERADHGSPRLVISHSLSIYPGTGTTDGFCWMHQAKDETPSRRT